MRTIRSLSAIAGAVALVSAAALSFADEGDKKNDRFGKGESATPYSMKCSLLRADGCKDGCLGVAANGKRPKSGKCNEVFVARVESGRVGGALGVVGGTSLEGAKWALIGEATDPAIRKVEGARVFIDAGAKTEQKDALKRIFASPPFADVAHGVAVTEVPIEFNKGEKDTDGWSVRIGEGTLSFDPRTGKDGKPMEVKNPPYLFDVKSVIVGKTRGTLDVGGARLDIQEGCGEVGTVEIEGEIPAMVVPAGSKKD